MAMRHFIFALAFLAAGSAAAQSPLADSTSTWYVAPLAGFVYISGGTTLDGVNVPSSRAGGAGLLVGRRVGKTVDLGFQAFVADNRDAGTAIQAMFGPQIGVTNRAGALETHARLGASAVVGEGAFDGAVSGLQSLGLQGATTLGYPVRVSGSFHLAPTLGAYGTVCTSRNEGRVAGAGCAEMGALAGVDVRFRAFGANVSVPFVAPIRLAGNTWQADNGPFLLQGAPVTTSLSISF